MASWAGGCINGIRFAHDGAGQGARDWAADACTSAIFTTAEHMIVDVSTDSDDMCSICGCFDLYWTNVCDDGGSYTKMSGSGEVHWSSCTDLICGNDVVVAEANGTENCSTMGVTRGPGEEKSGANDASLCSVCCKEVNDIAWAVSLTCAIGGKDYGFRLVDGCGCATFKTFTGININAVVAGKIEGVTKDSTRTCAIGCVTVSAYASDEASCDPKPIGPLVNQTVSNGSGVYTLQGGVMESGKPYFLHFYKDDTADLSDGSIEEVAVDA